MKRERKKNSLSTQQSNRRMPGLGARWLERMATRLSFSEPSNPCTPGPHTTFAYHCKKRILRTESRSISAVSVHTYYVHSSTTMYVADCRSTLRMRRAMTRMPNCREAGLNRGWSDLPQPQPSGIPGPRKYNSIVAYYGSESIKLVGA